MLLLRMVFEGKPPQGGGVPSSVCSGPVRPYLIVNCGLSQHAGFEQSQTQAFHRVEVIFLGIFWER